MMNVSQIYISVLMKLNCFLSIYILVGVFFFKTKSAFEGNKITRSFDCNKIALDLNTKLNNNLNTNESIQNDKFFNKEQSKNFELFNLESINKFSSVT